jgi:hypothetical protein
MMILRLLEDKDAMKNGFRMTNPSWKPELMNKLGVNQY